jgi:hypothetical protein
MKTNSRKSKRPAEAKTSRTAKRKGDYVQRFVRRFSDKKAELAAKISNDIAEDIDCGEPRTTLRMAVAYFADVACVESQRRAEAESTVAIFKSAKALMDVVLPPNAPGERPPTDGARTRPEA